MTFLLDPHLRWWKKPKTLPEPFRCHQVHSMLVQMQDVRGEDAQWDCHVGPVTPHKSKPEYFIVPAGCWDSSMSHRNYRTASCHGGLSTYEEQNCSTCNILQAVVDTQPHFQSATG